MQYQTWRWPALAGVSAIIVGLGAFGSSAAEAKDLTYKATVHVVPAQPGEVVQAVTGTVFEDRNRDGIQQPNERGVPGVLVSDGRNVVKTGPQGRYLLPRPSAADEAAGITVFITKPDGFDVPVNADHIPQFFYHHKPLGSPARADGQPFRYGGLAPTGALPRQINFPLIRGEAKPKFKMVVSGDTQAYSGDEIGYVRDTLVKELALMPDVEAVLLAGDNIGDDLALYPRFKHVLRGAQAPVYMVPGNHDLDFDAPTDDHSFDTYKREWGPAYYSFEIGEVHFIILDDVKYPCTPEEDNADGLHAFCNNPTTSPRYNGVVTPRQMTWLRNNLRHVPENKLIVISKHIPLQTFMDMNATQHQVDNALEIYGLLGYGPYANGAVRRPALALSGHTHTLENFKPGDVFAGWNTALGSRAPGPVPFPQIVVGAACGSWWSGDFDADGVPMSYQRDGTPRGYLVFEFDGNTFRHTFKATGQPSERQMSVSVLSPAFTTWFETLKAWVAGNPGKDQTPPVNIHDLPDTRFVPLAEVANTSIVANVWNGSRQHEVTLQIGDRAPVIMQRTQAGAGEGMLTSLDPFALAKQMQVARYAFRSASGDVNAQGFELFTGAKYGPADPRPLDSWMWTQTSMHIWTAKLPAGLEPGSHVAKVTAVDEYGRSFTETLTFEVGEERPNPYFDRERFTR